MIFPPPSKDRISFQPTLIVLIFKISIISDIGWFLLPTPDGVHEGEFDEGAEDEGCADDEPYLSGFDVGDFGQGAAGVASESDEGEHRAGSCGQNGRSYSALLSEATR